MWYSISHVHTSVPSISVIEIVTLISMILDISCISTIVVMVYKETIGILLVYDFAIWVAKGFAVDVDLMYKDTIGFILTLMTIFFYRTS